MCKISIALHLNEFHFLIDLISVEIGDSYTGFNEPVFKYRLLSFQIIIFVFLFQIQYFMTAENQLILLNE